MALLITYNAIVDRLSVLTNDQGMPLFVRIGIWNEQIENEKEEHAFNYPAVFVQFASLPWRTKQNAGGFQSPTQEEQQSDEAIITIHICHRYLQNETLSFPLIHPINQQVYFALQGQNTEDFGPMLRVDERQDTDHDGAIDWQMDFKVPMVQLGQSVDKKEMAADSITLIVE